MFPRHRLLIVATLLAALLFLPGIAFGQGAALSDSAQVPSGLVFDIQPSPACAGDSVYLRATWCPTCVVVTHAGYDSNGTLVVEADVKYGVHCDRCAFESTQVLLGRFAAGLHQLRFPLILHWQYPDDSTLTTEQTVTLGFEVQQCGGGGEVPFLDHVLITSKDGNGPICPDDSIRVDLYGTFPNDCYSLRRAELYYPFITMRDMTVIGPPIVRLLVDDGGCLGRPCVADTTAWQAHLVLPPLRSGAYYLQVQEWTVTCADTFPSTTPAQESFPFAVLSTESCREPAACYIARFVHDDDKCDTLIAAGGTASVDLSVASAVPLAGLQGVLSVDPPGLRITALEAVGPAAGMILNWTPTAKGARFVMFAQHGAPIPAIPPRWENFHGVPVLKVTVAAPASGEFPPVTRVLPLEMIASDSVGHGVPGCPMIMTFVYDPRLDPAARICADRPCDANGDGRSDVRDLVLMARCLYMACSDSARFDCDHDSDFDLEDAFCCALRILRRHEPPDTDAVRPPGELSATLGQPRLEGATLRVPVHLVGVASLGGAMLQLRFPSDRFDVVNVSTPGMLPLHSVEGGDLALGFVNVSLADEMSRSGPASAAVIPPNELDLEVTLRLKPGASPGGEIAIVSGQFAAMSGQRYSTDAEPSSVPVVPPEVASLAPPLPNPFSGETRFRVDLPRAANVELAVHDLSGRRVATIYRGGLPAGRRDFFWKGVDDRGTKVPQGVFFVLLEADGAVASRKVVLLREP